MLKDLVTNKNYLNSLFTEKDFNFINSFDNEIAEINLQISHQEKTRDKIVQFINSIADVLKLNDPEIDNYSLYQLSNKVAEIFEDINQNIQILSTLSSELNKLDNELVTLLLDIEKANHTEDYYEANIHTLKLKIDDFSRSQQSANEKLSINDKKINTFLSDPLTQKYLKGFQIDINSTRKFDRIENRSVKTSYRESNKKDNNVLIISEKDNKVFLPYTVEEINDYLEQFPDQYSSFESVVSKEFILPLSYYMSHPVLSRFREAYSLCRDREAKTILESLKYGMDLMFNRRLSPAVIAACKTQDQLANYLSCLEKNDLKSFTDFEIRFEMNPL